MSDRTEADADGGAVDDRPGTCPTHEATAGPLPSGTTVTSMAAGSEPAPVLARVPTGTVPPFIGRYKIGALIGIGGMGVVHRARDPDLKRRLAIKIVRQDRGRDQQARVLREAQAMARLRHPNVVPVFDAGTHHGLVYLVMPFLEGGTLGAWLRAAPRPWREVLDRFLAAARGLAAAHDVGLVHRDFKPDNVLLGSGDEVQVADFGLARIEHEAPSVQDSLAGATRDDLGLVTRDGTVMGTPAYMAPEQLDAAEVGPAADQFSFCVALHEGLFGERPFDVAGAGSTNLIALRDAIHAGRMRPVPAGRKAPRWLRAAIARGLRDAPEARWPSMATLVAEIERHLHAPRRVLVGAGAAVGVAAVALLATWPGRATPPAPTTTPGPAPPARWTERPLTFRGDVEAVALSPDGTQLAAYSGRQIIVLPSAGGEPRVVRDDVPDEPHLAWSHDNRTILAGWVEPGDDGRRRLHYRTIDVATGATTPIERYIGAWGRLLPDGAIASSANPVTFVQIDDLDAAEPLTCELPGSYRWIDGVQVAGDAIYVDVTYPDETRALFRTDAACARVDVVLPPSSNASFAVRHDGRVFAFVDDGAEQAVIEHDADGRPIGDPVPLPLGTSALVGVRDDGAMVLQRRTQTWRMVESSSSGTTTLARGSSAPSFTLSPDGSRFAVVERRAREATALYVVERDHAAARPPPLATSVAGAAWSPDGTQLAVIASRPGGAELSLIDVASGATRSLTRDQVSFSGGVAWLDERRVAYQRDDNRTYRWIDRVDGSTGTVMDEAPGWTFDVRPSPVDRTLALFWNRKEPGLWLVPPTGEPSRLRETTWTEVHAWSRDGQLWSSERGRIERHDPRTGATVHVRTLDLEPATQVVGMFPLDDDRVLLELYHATADLVLYAPER